MSKETIKETVRVTTGNKKYKIFVTKHDIESGDWHSCIGCPLSIAFRRALNHKYVLVGAKYGEVFREEQKDKAIFKFNLPLSAQKFIKQYDEGKPVKPFNFWITLNKT